MQILAHTGITLGVAALAAGTLPGDSTTRRWFERLGGWLDIRLLLVGALLPDIIDKPLGVYLLPGVIGTGRSISHTLLFLLVLAAAGFYLFRTRRQRWLLALAGGSLMHIVLDEMWRRPVTLFWPLLGFGFPRIELEGWFGNVFGALLNNPRIIATEIIGLIVLVWFGLWLIRRRRLGAFIRHGRVE